MGVCIDKDDIIIEKKNKLIQYELKSENMEKSFSYNEESNQNFESKHLERIVKTKRKNNSGPILKFLMEKNNNINS